MGVEPLLEGENQNEENDFKATPFYEYAERWYRTRKEPFISLASKASYKSCFIKHLLPTFGLMNMKAIDATQLQEFVNGFSGSSKSQITLVIVLEIVGVVISIIKRYVDDSLQQ